jgi:hypothetical protein
MTRFALSLLGTVILCVAIRWACPAAAHFNGGLTGISDKFFDSPLDMVPDWQIKMPVFHQAWCVGLCTDEEFLR